MHSWTPRPHFNRINPDICLISEIYYLKAFCSSGFRIKKKRSFFFAPFLIVGGVQLEAAAENEDVADDVADDDDGED